MPINATRIYSSSGELVSLLSTECASNQHSRDQTSIEVSVYSDTATRDSVNRLDDSQSSHPTDSTTGMSPDTVSPPTVLQSTGEDNTDSESALDADQQELLLS